MIGIYAIWVNEIIVYIGQSKDLERRIKQHKREIFYQEHKDDKYWYLREAAAAHLPITFTLVEVCSEDELNERELFYINWIKPCLNTVFNKENFGLEFFEHLDDIDSLNGRRRVEFLDLTEMFKEKEDIHNRYMRKRGKRR